MADNGEQRQIEKIEAAQWRAEHAEKIDTAEIARVVRTDGPTEFRSRYGLGRQVPTLPPGMLGRRVQSLAASGDGRDAPEPSPPAQTDQPTVRQDKSS